GRGVGTRSNGDAGLRPRTRARRRRGDPKRRHAGRARAPSGRTLERARGSPISSGSVKYRAVFFDAGETLVHPHPSFPELFGLILQREGYDADLTRVRSQIHLVSEQFARASREGELWTTSPEKSRA